jgi:hypothetical protein
MLLSVLGALSGVLLKSKGQTHRHLVQLFQQQLQKHSWPTSGPEVDMRLVCLQLNSFATEGYNNVAPLAQRILPKLNGAIWLLKLNAV